MRNHDPNESFRVATPLELLFDLVFVVGLGTTSAQFAHFVAEGASEIYAGIIGFAFCVFWLVWAWIYFTWFGSSFDTDDWLYRLAAFAAMIGVAIFAIGVPTVFESIAHGHFDIRTTVLGYVIMRLTLVSQWIRVARDDAEFRKTAISQIIVITTAQIAWILLAMADVKLVPALLITIVIAIYEFIGIFAMPRKFGIVRWHPHHIAERYSLLAIIALGETVVGTIAAISALVQHQGWSIESILIMTIGISLTATMWWAYFYSDNGELLERFPHRVSIFVMIHIVLYGAIAAVGAALHVIAYHVEGAAHLSPAGIVAAVAVPMGIYIVGLYALMGLMTKTFIPALWVWPVATVIVLAIGIVAAILGLPLGWSLVIIGFAPILSVYGGDLTARKVAISQEH